MSRLSQHQRPSLVQPTVRRQLPSQQATGGQTVLLVTSLVLTATRLCLLTTGKPFPLQKEESNALLPLA